MFFNKESAKPPEADHDQVRTYWILEHTLHTQHHLSNKLSSEGTTSPEFVSCFCKALQEGNIQIRVIFCLLTLAADQLPLS